MSKSMTYNEIAKMAGVSKATVSRYFNNQELLSEKVVVNIERILNENNYLENKLAKMLALGETNLIGIILPELHNPFYSQFLQLLTNRLACESLRVMLYTHSSSVEDELSYIDDLYSYNARGLINLSHTIPSRVLKNSKIPTVVVEREHSGLAAVISDNRKGAILAAQKLISDKCEHIVVIDDPNNDDFSSERLNTFIQYITEQKMECNHYKKSYSNNYEQDLLYISKVIREIVSKAKNKKIGIFCGNDFIASIVVRACLNHKLLFPDEIEVIGFDNSPRSYETDFPFSTIKQDIETLVEYCVEVLNDQIYNNKKNIKVADVELINRGSTL